VAYQSDSNNLIGSDNSGFGDIFLHDMKTGKTKLVSRKSDGTIGNGLSDDPVLSDDAKVISYESRADNLAGNDTNDAYDIFVTDPIR
jgi:hypothetical protein